MGEVSLSPGTYSLDVLAYYDILAVWGIVTIFLALIVIEFLFFCYIALSAVFLNAWRLRHAKERAGIPTDYAHYEGQFDFEVTEEMIA